MREGIKDFAAVLRFGHLAVGFPGVAYFTLRRLSSLNAAYDRTVKPIVTRTISDPDERIRLNLALGAMSAKIGMAMLCYARLTDCAERYDIIALAGAVTRLYDDLIDGDVDPKLDGRLGDLFSNRQVEPESDLERLHMELIGEIRSQRRPSGSDTATWALAELHQCQLLSRKQREECTSLPELEEIRKKKGAMANLTLCALVNEEMDAQAQGLVVALGEAFQSMDDYMDSDQDKRNGIATAATLGVVTLMDIGGHVCILRPAVTSLYGRVQARQYFGMIYFVLVKCAVRRRLPRFEWIARRFAGRSRAMSFLARSADAVTAAQVCPDDM